MPNVYQAHFVKPVKQLELRFSNEYWRGLTRLDSAKAILASTTLSDDEKQQKLAKVFGPDAWMIEVTMIA